MGGLRHCFNHSISHWTWLLSLWKPRLSRVVVDQATAGGQKGARQWVAQGALLVPGPSLLVDLIRTRFKVNKCHRHHKIQRLEAGSDGDWPFLDPAGGRDSTFSTGCCEASAASALWRFGMEFCWWIWDWEPLKRIRHAGASTLESFWKDVLNNSSRRSPTREIERNWQVMMMKLMCEL